jgi:hypothetical protein
MFASLKILAAVKIVCSSGNDTISFSNLSTGLHGVRYNKITLALFEGFAAVNMKGQVKVKVILRPTASRPACPGVRPPCAKHDQFFVSLEIILTFAGCGIYNYIYTVYVLGFSQSRNLTIDYAL